MSENVHIKRKVTLKEKQSDTHSDSPTPRKWPKFVIPIIAVAAIAVLAVAFWPKEDRFNGEQITQNAATDVQSTDTQDNTTATNNADDNSVEEESQTVEQVVDEALTAPAEDVSETKETVETTTAEPAVAQPTTNNTTPKPSSHSKPANNTAPSHYTSGTLTGDVEEDAKAVIRGEFGNGADRGAALGNRYNEIQSKVNEIIYNKRQIN